VISILRVGHELAFLPTACVRSPSGDAQTYSPLAMTPTLLGRVGGAFGESRPFSVHG
jgi:hypothetical protein